MAPTFAQSRGKLILRVPVSVHQLRIGAPFFDRVEIGALDVLDDCDFKNFGVGKFSNNDWEFVETRALRCAPTPLTRNDLKSVTARSGPNDDRLD